MEIIFKDESVVIEGSGLCADKTFNCGQCFRFNKKGDLFEGVAFGRRIFVRDEGNRIVLFGVSEREFNERFFDYFDLGRDYAAIDRLLEQDPVLRNVIPFSKGIRILNQEPFEAVVSFIISAANNIPRIKGIVSTLCENFGQRKRDIFGEYFCFPDAKVLADANIERLSVIKAGFRTEYILDCARRFASGELEPYEIKGMTYSGARAQLMKIKGVGTKVADCALLFGFGFIDSFPQDVWIKRVLKSMYNTKGAPPDFKGYGGIAQQYLFYYAREHQI